jgi:hypothetical protein
MYAEERGTYTTRVDGVEPDMRAYDIDAKPSVDVDVPKRTPDLSTSSERPNMRAYPRPNNT